MFVAPHGELPMTMTDETQKTKRPRKMAREPQAGATAEVLPKRETKAGLVLELLQRPEGATIDQLASATGWLPHTTRAALTDLKKKGHVVTSNKADGQSRIYRVVAP